MIPEHTNHTPGQDPSRLCKSSSAPRFGRLPSSPPSRARPSTSLFSCSYASSERPLSLALLKPLTKASCACTCSPLQFFGKPSVASLADHLPAVKCTPSRSGLGERAESPNGDFYGNNLWKTTKHSWNEYRRTHVIAHMQARLLPVQHVP